jgi:nucleotide-binding universal stress UspA family protein
VHGLRRRQDDSVSVDACADSVRPGPASEMAWQRLGRMGAGVISNGPSAPLAARSCAKLILREGRKIVRTIVCGIDGSPGARSALRVATELAEALRLRVVAVHVADGFGGGQELNETPAILRMRGNAERVLANVLYDEQLVGRVDWRAEVGNVAERLVAVAAEERALLILLGARSKGKPWTFLRSRIAGEIVRKSSVPVIVVPPQGELEVAPPQIAEPSRVASRMRLDAEPDPFQASAGAALSAKSR